MNFYKMIVEVLSLFEKGEKIMKFGSIYRKNTMKDIDLKDILKEVDSQNLYLGESFKIKGFLSKYATVEEPKTYFMQSYKLGKIYLEEKGGEFCRSAELKIKPCSMPVVKFKPIENKEQENKIIAFIYSPHAKERFLLEINEGKTLKVKEENKFIPIILNEDLIYNLSNKEVEMIVKAKAINFKIAEEVYSYKTESFNEIKDYFYNIYNENIVSIILECVELLDEHKVDVKDEVYCFGIEYKVTSKFIKYDELCRRLDNILNKFCFNWDLKGFVHDGIEVVSKISHTDIQMNICGQYVGFYMPIKINDRKNYKHSLEKLRSLISRIMIMMGDNFEWETTFISDYTKEYYFLYLNNKK
ncbi:hypothetical protein [Clostridium perfringens]|uniref:hypothetical protein n=1 Tax=Clostridium perfringens TaxID=1502 RepID=UPI0024BCBF6F|nr:hypothetical protein [Clostridium perfringens]